jgi:DNA-binding transcriptional ArsR family regulator
MKTLSHHVPVACCAIGTPAAKSASATVVKHRANIFKAMGHASRIRILELLARGETCVCDIALVVGSDMSTVSRHLSVLRNAGLIEDDKRGLNVFYKLSMPCILDFFNCIDKMR